MSEPRGTPNPEWGTFGLMVLCYLLWGAVLFRLADLSVAFAIPMAGFLVAFHASLTHEVLHGHPFRRQWLNETLMALPLNLCIPYNRFRDLHLAHHRDANLTDPYDDPESNYLDPATWSQMPRVLKVLYRFNNTLLGRILIGPAIGQAVFFVDEGRAALRGDREVWRAWMQHLPGAALVLWLVSLSPMPVWAYLISAYLGLSLLKIRTFLEHRAHEKARGRTVIVEDRGVLAFLFLNNNLHVVHHMNPKAAWYQLPALYRDGRSRYQTSNEAYVYRSYGDVFRRYFLRAKDPVPHPLWPKG
ncbi:fatty acid desaturase [Ruegeria sp. 2012CJ41-6]|uniref:Fatty acid desaturase n=1 Tax=Ruegeria spongiae TaxID=2942209 RepID=A0ABT0Q911_9RHOB|nr:fatty acid desaturase [Ruegeria spongiae]MCL6285917.1 fatty acid desaturase [Ruegeria spongiae]